MSYGFDGNVSALDWAILCGFHTVSDTDQRRLVDAGYFTPCGGLIINTLPTNYQTHFFRRAVGARAVTDHQLSE